MPRTIYLENWHSWLKPTIDDVLLAAGNADSDSHEQSSLLAERNVLQEMIRQVQEIHPDQRQALESPLIACTVRGAIDVPAEIVERVGEIHDIYRRFRGRLLWPSD